MTRRLFAFTLVAALVAAQAGCHWCGGSRLCSSSTKAPCQTVGLNGGCFDAAGQPMACPPDTGVLPGGSFPVAPGVIPGNGTLPEMHMPGPTDNIPSPVPAVPYSAPPPPPNLPIPGSATLPYPALPGTPVKK